MGVSMQFTKMVEDMASVKATGELQKESTEKILKILEGNGQKGLIQESIEIKKDLEQTQNRLAEAISDVTRLTEAVDKLSRMVDTLSMEFRKHTADGNPQHETIIAAFRAKPLQFTVTGIALLVFSIVGVTSGFFEHILMFFKNLIP